MSFTEADREILNEPCYMRLATLMPDGSPQNTVLWYRLVDDAIHIICPESAQKVRNLDLDNRISAVIEDPETPHRYLEIRGEGNVIRDDALARRELREVAMRYIGDRADDFVAGLSTDPRVVLRLVPSQIRRYGMS